MIVLCSLGPTPPETIVPPVGVNASALPFVGVNASTPTLWAKTMGVLCSLAPTPGRLSPPLPTLSYTLCKCMVEAGGIGKGRRATAAEEMDGTAGCRTILLQTGEKVNSCICLTMPRHHYRNQTHHYKEDNDNCNNAHRHPRHQDCTQDCGPVVPLAKLRLMAGLPPVPVQQPPHPGHLLPQSSASPQRWSLTPDTPQIICIQYGCHKQHRFVVCCKREGSCGGGAGGERRRGGGGGGEKGSSVMLLTKGTLILVTVGSGSCAINVMVGSSSHAVFDQFVWALAMCCTCCQTIDWLSRRHRCCRRRCSPPPPPSALGYTRFTRTVEAGGIDKGEQAPAGQQCSPRHCPCLTA
jgi:hypothetical protein